MPLHPPGRVRPSPSSFSRRECGAGVRPPPESGLSLRTGLSLLQLACAGAPVGRRVPLAGGTRLCPEPDSDLPIQLDLSTTVSAHWQSAAGWPHGPESGPPTGPALRGHSRRSSGPPNGSTPGHRGVATSHQTEYVGRRFEKLGDVAQCPTRAENPATSVASQVSRRSGWHLRLERSGRRVASDEHDSIRTL
jgi:hypothetical protein